MTSFSQLISLPKDELLKALSQIDTAFAQKARFAIEKDKNQLAVQLAGRESSKVSNLAKEADSWNEVPWIKPLRKSFEPTYTPLLKTLNAHTNFVGGLAIMPDNRTVFSSSEDGKIIKWDIQTGEPLKVLHTGYAVNVLALDPDCNFLVAGNDDYKITIYNPETLDVIRVLAGHDDYVSDLTVTKDIILSVSKDQSVRVWNLKNGKIIHTFKNAHNAWTHVCTITPEGNIGITGAIDNTLKAWDLINFEELPAFFDNGGDIYLLNNDLFIPNKNYTEIGHKSYPDGLAVTPDGKTLFSAKEKIIAWDIESKKQILDFAPQAWSVEPLVINGENIIIGSHSIEIWNYNTKKLVGTISTAHSGKDVDKIVISKDRKILVSGGHDSKVKVWDISLIKTSTDHTEPASSIIVSKCGKYVATGASDKEGRIWDINNGNYVASLKGHKDLFVTARAVTDDGALVLTTTKGEVTFWDFKTGLKIAEYQHQSTISSINAFACSPDGESFVTGEVGVGLTLWNRKTGKSKILEGNTSFVETIHFVDNDTIFTTTCYLSDKKPGYCQWWSVSKGKLIKQIDLPNGEYLSRTIIKDNIAFCASTLHRLIAFDLLKQEQLWEIDSNKSFYYVYLLKDSFYGFGDAHLVKIDLSQFPPRIISDTDIGSGKITFTDKYIFHWSKEVLRMLNINKLEEITQFIADTNIRQVLMHNDKIIITETNGKVHICKFVEEEEVYFE